MYPKTWSIYSMSLKPVEGSFTDVVYIAFWQCQATDSGYTADIMGNVALPSPEPGAPFTPYPDLTQQQVLDWVFAVMGPQTVSMIEAEVDVKLQNLINPPIISLPLPWIAPV